MNPRELTARPATVAATVGAFTVAGLSFAAYPALRPYSDEASLDGAAAMASTAWVLAHSIGMVGFIALTLAVWSLRRLRPSRPASAAAGLTWPGVSLVLPYYGAETFGGQVIAAQAQTSGDAALLGLVDAFRYDAVALSFFGTGLVLLAAAGIALALALRDAAPVSRAGGLLVGAALATYLPQFFLSPSLRVTHGAVLGIGCLLLAAGRGAAGTGRGAGRAGTGAAAGDEIEERYSAEPPVLGAGNR